jgi:glutaredoxin
LQAIIKENTILKERKEMIKIFSKEGCPYCEYAKVALQQHGYKYEEIRIDEDNCALEFIKREGHKSVPQIYVGETLLVDGGFQGLNKMTTKQIATRIREINGN